MNPFDGVVLKSNNGFKFNKMYLEFFLKSLPKKFKSGLREKIKKTLTFISRQLNLHLTFSIKTLLNKYRLFKIYIYLKT